MFKAIHVGVGSLLAGLAILPVIAFASGLSLVINSMTPGTSVGVGQALTFTASGAGADNLGYLISEDFNGSGSTLNSSAIDSITGAFRWTPTNSDLGVHKLTVEVTDYKGLVKTQLLTIAVGTTAVAPGSTNTNTNYAIAVQSVYPSTSVQYGQSVSFSVTPTNFTPSSYTLTDSFTGGTIVSTNITTGGTFSWMPTSADVGTHVLTLTGVDSLGHSAQTAVTLQVTAPYQNTAVPTVTTPVVTTPAIVPTVLGASTGPSLAPAQIQAVMTILQAFGATQSMMTQVAAVLAGTGYVPAAPAATTRTAPVSSSSSTSASGTFTSYLALGSRGAEVTALQNKLAALGFYSGNITGYFGAQTAAAVKAFQSEHGITAAGYVGSSTRAVLNQ